ncbi:MAG: hypothetical protein KatS3mg023_1158 [Armatimonadota bacterium]|nr:MAG: hypothetical protein KatS3mg023_1158 [Armatimonadota bacterium]
MGRYKWVAIIGLASGAVFLPVMGAPFVADDYLIFFHVAREGIWGIAITPGPQFLRPLTSAMYYIEYHLWGLSPLTSHIVSTLTHVICTLLTGVLTKKIATKSGLAPEITRRSALISSALFAVLPAHAEAVAWIASRADIMATIFCLLCLILLARDSPSHSTVLETVLFVSCFAVALLFKESAVVLPLLVVVWLTLGYERDWKRVLPFAGVAAAYLLTRFLIVGKIGGYANWGSNLLSPWQLAMNGIVYLSHLLQPAPLFGVGRDLWDTLLYLSTGLALLVLVRSRPSTPTASGFRRLVLLLCAWTVICMLPVLPLKPALGHLMNSRYVYLASTSMAALAGIWLAQRWDASRVRFTFVALVALYALGTMRLSQAWYWAGRVAQTSLQSLAQVTSGQKPILLLSIPDHYRGAYIWRNSLHEAILLYVPQIKSSVYVLSRFTMRLTPYVSVNYRDGIVTLSSQSDIFLPPESHHNLLTGVGEINITPQRISIGSPLTSRYRLLRYENGRFVDVTN